MAFRTRLLRSGVLTTWVVSAFALVYLALTWQSPHRPVLVSLIALASLGALAIRGVPPARLIETPRFERLVLGWHLTHVLVAGAMYYLDGGDGSPFLALFFLSVAFAGGALPHAKVIAVATLTAVALLVIWVLHGHTHADAVLWAGALFVTAGVCATTATDRERSTAAVGDAQEESLRRLARVVEYRDSDTGGHIERIGEYSKLVAAAMGMPEPACHELQLASTMHDIGKVAVPDAVLLKPGKLDADERAIMETHAQVGFDMLTGSGSDLLELAATIALTHHERYDGAGYPNGLAGEAIPLPGRIVAVADVFDAITSKRVYKKAVDLETAAAIVVAGRGTQFDPEVVDAFVTALPVIAAVRSQYPNQTVVAVPADDAVPLRSAA